MKACRLVDVGGVRLWACCACARAADAAATPGTKPRRVANLLHLDACKKCGHARCDMQPTPVEAPPATPRARAAMGSVSASGPGAAEVLRAALPFVFAVARSMFPETAEAMREPDALPHAIGAIAGEAFGASRKKAAAVDRKLARGMRGGRAKKRATR